MTGNDALRSAMHVRGFNQVSLSKALGCSQQAISRWLKGERRPDAAWRSALALVLDIPEHVWLTDNEARSLSQLQSLR